MRRVFIIGNSGAARECYWLFNDMRGADGVFEQEYIFQGFLSWRGYAGDLKELSQAYRGEALEHAQEPNDVFIIGIGDPSLRRDVYETMKKRKAPFLTLRHPLCDINPSARIGEANIFQRNSTVFCNASLGNANYLNGAVNLSHDAQVGDYNFFGPFSLVLGGSQVGSGNVFAARCSVLPHARVGNGNIIAPNSVIYKGCRHNLRLAGNPALVIGHQEEAYHD